MRPQEVSAELEAFIRKEIGLSPKKQLNPSDTLEHDLGVTGDDADDFMDAFSKHFNVKPGDFEFLRYFEMEGFSVWPFSIFTNWLHRRWGIKKYDQTEPLTVAMLQQAIALGVWDSERLKERRDEYTKE
ncbi:DUF1493 family protein [Paraburkholderia sp. Ac-20336]|uniref:DUF1493 family protein n=1 Tax=unclassified Paraburkholderia TaxID=2615204 RepID=UPI00197EF02E|nr:MULTISPECIES: DUF1493 family protein [unclassified Paraburkholderia]MBN3805622.1 DUF1493 family protein [Paraburkholderia sp. Ac-20336]MBN3850017.1 DUF1493 family protein [Paraburkholderia sp. Ac-20342]